MSIARLMQQAAAGVPTGGGVVWTDPDLANASYDSVSFSVSGQETSLQEIFFKPDGVKLYIIGAIGDSVYEYDLSTAWDISSASYLQGFSIASQEITASGLWFKPDGTKMYVIGTTGDDVNEYDLSSAWDVSTASYSQNFSVSSQEAGPQQVIFKPDGTKMYVTGSLSDNINEYSLSSAWDISTASYVQNFSLSSQDTTPRSIFFNPDGTKLFLVGSETDAVYQYSLSTGWDVSSASYDSVSFSVVTQATNPTGFFFKDDGSKMYIGNFTNNTIYQYSTD
jgi:hypothetical protein